MHVRISHFGLLLTAYIYIEYMHVFLCKLVINFWLVHFTSSAALHSAMQLGSTKLLDGCCIKHACIPACSLIGQLNLQYKKSHLT